jgi:transcription-repair coupling factor (superfamily II helicase)
MSGNLLCVLRLPRIPGAGIDYMEQRIAITDTTLLEVFNLIAKSDITVRVSRTLATGASATIKPAGRLFLELLAVHLSNEGNSPVVFILHDEDEMLFMREELKAITGTEVGFFYSFADEESFSMDEVEQRLLALERILSKSLSFIITNPEGLSYPIPTESMYRQYTIQFQERETLDFTSLAERLSTMGFSRVATVGEIGEFSVRGSIVDIYGYGMDYPHRIEFQGDEVISIRSFDPFTQRTRATTNQCKVLPIVDQFGEGETRTLLNYLSPQTLFVYSELLFLDYQADRIPDLGGRRQLVLSNDGLVSEFQKPMEFYGDLPRLKTYLGTIEKDVVVVCCESDEERARSEFLLADEFPGIAFVTFNIGEGIESHKGAIHILTDKELFGKGFHPQKVRKSELTFRPEDLSELKPGDFVVHEDYGIAVFERIGSLEHEQQKTECLVLRYAGGDMLYVPIGAMGRVSKYIGLDRGTPRLSSLSSMKWERKKRNARKALADMTEDLLRLYAVRSTAKGFPFSPDTVWQKELEVSFPYEETNDQLQVIREIKRDMESSLPMDRLVCGEVGYGKTEVAIRAAFKAAMDSKQVILLAPTTVLAEQHYHTFTQRMKGFPLRVAMLSRFVKRNKQKEIMSKIASGDVDIVIGTHRLLGSDIAFHDPGLLIIDEEHRFGVAQKEKLKKKRKEMDVLSMSATPIPRTLQFSLLSIRDFSIIETAPKGRLSVTTRIIHFASEFIRGIILDEIRRGGQVFFVHNRIQSLEAIASRIRRLVPEAHIAVTHGGMRSEVIEQRMLDFLSCKSNVLVTTSIIESGLDIPNANTIIIDRADTYGIAQLHQLRGRVGRSNRKAYCYLIVPHRISHEASKRLSTIYTHSHLGSGLALAMKDLEIRGAGNLLGRKQHGHIVSIGYDLYMKLLQETVQGLKGERKPKEIIPEVFASIDAYLPREYIEDESARVDIYRRLSSVQRIEAIAEIRDELQDRFGALPREAQMLLLIAHIKMLCTGMGITRVSIHTDHMELWFAQDRFPTKKSLETMVRELDKHFFMDYSEGFFRLRFDTELKKIMEDLKKVLQFLPKYAKIKD